jgi:hypothetical protein
MRRPQLVHSRFFLEKNLFAFSYGDGKEFRLEELTVKEFLTASRLTYEDFIIFSVYVKMPKPLIEILLLNKEKLERFLNEFNNFHIPPVRVKDEERFKKIMEENRGKNLLQILYDSYKTILINASLIMKVPLKELYENYTIRQIQEILEEVNLRTNKNPESPASGNKNTDYLSLKPGQSTKKIVTIDKWGVKKTTSTEVLEKRN